MAAYGHDVTYTMHNSDMRSGTEEHSSATNDGSALSLADDVSLSITLPRTVTLFG